MSKNFAHLVSHCPDEDFPALRELMTYNIACEQSCSFERDPETWKVHLDMTSNALHWSRQMEFPWVLRHGDFQPHHEVLEIGAGVSCLQYALANRCGKVRTLEYEPHFIPLAAKTIASFGMTEKISQHQGDSRAIPFPDNTFDRVVCVSVLEHVEGNRLGAVAEAVRVLKPGGLLLLTMDVILAGTAATADMLGQGEALTILRYLGISHAEQKDRLTAVKIPDNDLLVTVVMICHEKLGAQK